MASRSKPSLPSNSDFFAACESHVARFEPESTAEELFVELSRVEKVHKAFNRYLRRNKIKFNMPRKSEVILERRRLFINWYIQQHPEKGIEQAVNELTYLTFASRTTIYNVLSGHQ